MSLDVATPISPAPDAELGFRPLYRQVKDALVKRIASGAWAPGSAIPSEFQLAAEIGVSQGTVRKALDEMATENLLVRRQGRGTFVAAHDEARILFQYFKLTPDDGVRRFPDSRVISASAGPADMMMSERLGMLQEASVIIVRRVRDIDGKPAIAETIVLPADLYPGILDGPIPNNLYDTFARRFGVTIARAQEQLKAVGLGAEDAALLERPVNHPALSIDRVAYGLNGRPAEWRVSVCLTETSHYLSDLK